VRDEFVRSGDDVTRAKLCGFMTAAARVSAASQKISTNLIECNAVCEAPASARYLRRRGGAFMALLAGRDLYRVIVTSRLCPSVPAGRPRGKAVKRLISRCVLVNLGEHLFLRSLEASP